MCQTYHFCLCSSFFAKFQGVALESMQHILFLARTRLLHIHMYICIFAFVLSFWQKRLIMTPAWSFPRLSTPFPPFCLFVPSWLFNFALACQKSHCALGPKCCAHTHYSYARVVPPISHFPPIIMGYVPRISRKYAAGPVPAV